MSFEEPNDPRSGEISNNQIQLNELAKYEERTLVQDSWLLLCLFIYRTEMSYFYMEYNNQLIIIVGLWHTFRIIW